MASKLVFNFKANISDLETLNSSGIIGTERCISSLVNNTTAPIRSYNRSRFADHFMYKDDETDHDEGTAEFEVNNKQIRTILSDKIQYKSKFLSAEEDANVSQNVFECCTGEDEDSKVTLKGGHKNRKLRVLKHQPSKCLSKRIITRAQAQSNVQKDELISHSPFSIPALIEAVNIYENSTLNKKTDIMVKFKGSLASLLLSQEGTSLFMEFYTLQKNDNIGNSKISYFAELDFITLALSESTQNISEILRIISQTDQTLVYRILNNEQTWETLISSKNGKNLVECIMISFFKGNPSCHSKLFSVIHSNFLNYSKSNYTTFIIQKYISHFKTGEAFDLILSSFDELINSRNGIFVLISGLKAYKNDRLSCLLDKIMAKVEILSKGIYTSTMIEFVFRTFPQFCIDFTNNKLVYLIGKQ